ncbi:MAG: ABC transporter permease [Anaerolineales bacterium]|nr:ABC transporter permease [Anaerolineales bacterium]
MTRYILRRILIIPFALILIHFLAFAYATAARPIRAARTPYLREQIESVPLGDAYLEHIQQVLSGNVNDVPGPLGGLGESVWAATKASLGLLLPAMLVSTLLGLLLGLQAVRTQPAGVKRWLTPIATVGLATPSFYLGSLGILGIVYYMLWRGPGAESPLPISGFGWDKHLILPVVVLSLRPVVQIAQVIAGLMSGELRKDYVVAERSFGYSWRNIRWKYSLKNILAPVLLTIAGTFRLTVGELVVVEWLYRWPGLGYLLASALVPGELSTNLGATPLFLNPPLIAAIITVISALFLVVDMAASIAVRVIDPRLRPHDDASASGGGL